MTPSPAPESVSEPELTQQRDFANGVAVLEKIAAGPNAWDYADCGGRERPSLDVDEAWAILQRLRDVSTPGEGQSTPAQPAGERVTPFRVVYSERYGAYRVSIPDWDGGDVYHASDYDALAASIARLQAERDNWRQQAIDRVADWKRCEEELSADKASEQRLAEALQAARAHVHLAVARNPHLNIAAALLAEIDAALSTRPAASTTSPTCRCGTYPWPADAVRIEDSVGMVHRVDGVCEMRGRKL